MSGPCVSSRAGDQVSGTARFYVENAKRYAHATRDVDMSAIYAHFLKYLKPGSRILDAGSGSGRDTLEFLKRGYLVEAFDASAALAALSSRLTGLETRVLRFEEFEDRERFDGIWACAALLHVPRDGLKDVLVRLMRGLTLRGVLYASFKFGNEDRTADDGRVFTNLDERSLLHLVKQVPYKLKVCEMWRTQGESDLKGRDIWLNVIIQRCS
jgi:SAM-dependent methyltransferase